jgi:chemotaxis protein MotB
MKKVILIITLATISLTSCVSKKKFSELEAKNKEIQDLLNTATVKLNTCLTEREALANQVDFLKKNKIELDRKILADLAENNPKTFARILQNLK